MVELVRGHRYLTVAVALAGLNLIMLAVTLVLVQQTSELRQETRDAVAASKQQVLNARAACERGNGLRAAVRFLLGTQEEIADVVSQAASSAEIRGYFRGIKTQYEPYRTNGGVQWRNCAADYPLP